MITKKKKKRGGELKTNLSEKCQETNKEGREFKKTMLLQILIDLGQDYQSDV